MYSLDCEYFDKEFSSITLLLEYVMISGMDPHYMITLNGKSIGEKAIEHIVF
jgi:hypothetical protein